MKTSIGRQLRIEKYVETSTGKKKKFKTSLEWPSIE